MIIDRVGTTVTGDIAVRSARLRWGDETFEIELRGPSDAVERDDDASGFVVMALLPAMTLGEDLDVDAPASRRLLDRLRTAVAAYVAWNPLLRPPEIRVRGFASDTPAAPGVASFFSRGVDSLLSAALDGREQPLTHLLFCDGLEPRHSRAVADEEIRRASAAADLLGLPLFQTSTNVRSFTDGLSSWVDFHGAALAGIALTLSPAFRQVVIPSSESYATLAPYGSSPLLEHLFSTSAVEIQHDDISLTRAGKVACLAEQRPDLLRYLKVCYAEDRVDNCGRCGKCVITMAALQAADALPLAPEFPSSINLDDIGKRVKPLQSRMQLEAVIRALGGSGPNGELRAALLNALRTTAYHPEGAGPESHPLWSDPSRTFETVYLNRLISLIDYGEPYPPLDDAPERELITVRLRQREAARSSVAPESSEALQAETKLCAG